MLGLFFNPNTTLTQILLNVAVARFPRLLETLTTLTEVIMALKNINFAPIASENLSCDIIDEIEQTKSSELKVDDGAIEAPDISCEPQQSSSEVERGDSASLSFRSPVTVFNAEHLKQIGFSDERKAKIPMTVPKGYIKNKFQLETFIFSEGKKYVLTLFVKKPQLKHIVKRGQGYPATNVPLIFIVDDYTTVRKPACGRI